MDPFGTPQGRDECEERRSPIITEKLLFTRYELNHWRAMLRMPTYCSKQDTGTAWSTVSKAAVRSSRTITVGFPASTDKAMLLCTFNSADSVLSGSGTRLEFIKNRIGL